ncbi:uncharacterized protein LOC115033525 [Acyrthosiphon pisum]|uniref:Uncharacterized protein n=1 Tax=Acyrthosiphon pisum TaxID=7029 RepID=A0A8R2NL62_ACYPI|nr:uncharacterized protein LOC115033525 [Acyrthosiphon pisum]
MTLVMAQEGPKTNATTTRPGKAFKNNKNSMLDVMFRAISSATESTTVPVKECHKNTSCGWVIYTPFTRRIDYFMKNSCIYNPNLACLQTDDDLVANAYVYRCVTPYCAFVF